MLFACGGGGEVDGDDTASEAGAVDTLEGVKNAVIQIEAEGSFVDPQVGMVFNAAGRGSGFIIDPSGIAVTNNHVVTGAALVRVWVGGEADGEVHNARVLGVSECTDLAVLDIEGDGFPYLAWYPETISVGLDVYAAGFPLGEPEFTLTRGIISKESADGDTQWASVDGVVMHDATINPGNSGGPLITKDGQVVGVNYMGNPDANQFFAITAQQAQSVAATLQGGEDYLSIGINGTAIYSENLSGIWVASVESGSPADLAGVEGGDIILTIEDLILSTDGTMADYCDILRTHNADDTLGIQVYRYAEGVVYEGQLNGRELAPMGVVSGQSGGDTSSSPPPTQPPPPTPPAATGYTSYMTVTDDHDSIQIEVPSSWTDIDGRAWSFGGVRVGASIWAAPDLEDFNDDWRAPGIIFNATDQVDQVGGCTGVLEEYEARYMAACTFADTDMLVDSGMILMTDVYENCGGAGGQRVEFYCVMPEDESFLLYLKMGMMSDADIEAAPIVFGSLQMIGPFP
jgi:serine protease Do